MRLRERIVLCQELQKFRIEGRSRKNSSREGVPYMNQVSSGFMDFGGFKEKDGQHY